MNVIRVPNVHTALPEVLHHLEVKGVKRDSRNGPVVMFEEPTAIVYEHPEQRVMLWPERDANPFFHFFEALWMLSGRNDVAYVEQFASKMARFSDDGKTFNAAYGYRWRKHFKQDQLPIIINQLASDATSRRCYLGIWDGAHDLGLQSKDLPCNVGATFQINSRDELDMVVHNRSNDIVWGALGANAVHFSFLQEFIARSIGCKVGKYWQVSSNLHGYIETVEPLMKLADLAVHPYRSTTFDWYQNHEIPHYPIMQVDYKIWLQDLEIFMKDGPIIGFRDPFFRQVATPLLRAFQAWRNGEGVDRYDTALEILEQCRADDWKIACVQWIERRKNKFLRARDDGPVEG